MNQNTSSKKINFCEEIKGVPDEVLLKIGKRIASSDYEVRGFTSKRNPNLYKNRRLLLSAVNRAYSIGAFNHREQAMKILEDYLEELEYKNQLKMFNG